MYLDDYTKRCFIIKMIKELDYQKYYSLENIKEIILENKIFVYQLNIPNKKHQLVNIWVTMLMLCYSFYRII